jgi:hypothetical protein
VDVRSSRSADAAPVRSRPQRLCLDTRRPARATLEMSSPLRSWATNRSGASAACRSGGCPYRGQSASPRRSTPYATRSSTRQRWTHAPRVLGQMNVYAVGRFDAELFQGVSATVRCVPSCCQESTSSVSVRPVSTAAESSVCRPVASDAWMLAEVWSGSIRAGVHADRPAVGSVEVTTLPDESTATQSDADGQAIELRSPPASIIVWVQVPRRDTAA